ncbi:MAG: TerC family protein [Bacteroidetes bacterium]|nr:TerC family protein [Bacteroidota bacterium]
MFTTEFFLFNLFVLLMLSLDLFIFHRKNKVMAVREALLWTGFWISLALVFNILIYYWKGSKTALEFLTGYLIEESLSVDNLFVFLLIFSYFGMPREYQYRALFWGIIGTLILRIIFIFIGVALINSFHFVIYIFGLFLIYAGIRMLFHKEEDVDLEKNPVLKFIRKRLRVTTGYESGRFFIRKNKRLYATSSFLVLVMLVIVDFFFALDSIPAIIAITQDPFIVYTSNVFAILGLRALYFAIAGVMQLFHFLNYGLSLILAFIGVKLLLQDFFPIDTSVALITIAGILATTIILSLIFPKKEK